MKTLQKQLHEDQISNALNSILLQFKKNNYCNIIERKKNVKLNTWSYKLLTNNDNTMCFILLFENNEVSKFWSMWGESASQFLNRIDLDVKSITKL